MCDAQIHMGITRPYPGCLPPSRPRTLISDSVSCHLGCNSINYPVPDISRPTPDQSGDGSGRPSERKLKKKKPLAARGSGPGTPSRSCAWAQFCRSNREDPSHLSVLTMSVRQVDVMCTRGERYAPHQPIIASGQWTGCELIPKIVPDVGQDAGAESGPVFVGCLKLGLLLCWR